MIERALTDLLHMSVTKSKPGRYQANWKNSDGSYRTAYGADPVSALRSLLRINDYYIATSGRFALRRLGEQIVVEFDGAQMNAGAYDDMARLFELMSGSKIG